MSGAGKGDKPRRVNRKRFEENMERIFGRKCLKCRKKYDMNLSDCPHCIKDEKQP